MAQRMRQLESVLLQTVRAQLDKLAEAGVAVPAELRTQLLRCARGAAALCTAYPCNTACWTPRCNGGCPSWRQRLRMIENYALRLRHCSGDDGVMYACCCAALPQLRLTRAHLLHALYAVEDEAVLALVGRKLHR